MSEDLEARFGENVNPQPAPPKVDVPWPVDFTVDENGFLIGVGKSPAGTEMRFTADLVHISREDAERVMRFNMQHSRI